MKDFRDKVVIVTGSSMGIGKAIARSLARRNAKVVLNGRNGERLAAVERELRDAGHEVLGVQGDIALEQDCQKLIDTTINRFGKIDILVNNAGASMRGAASVLSSRVISSIFQVNTVGPFVLSGMAIPYLKKTKGSIIFISSLAGLRGLPSLSAYSASKMALTALAESLRIEHSHDDIHFGIVYVGYTEIEPGKTALGPDGQLIMLEQRSGFAQRTIHAVAETVIRHIARRKKQTFIGVSGHLFAFLVKQLPTLAEWLIKNQYEKKMLKLYK